MVKPYQGGRLQGGSLPPDGHATMYCPNRHAHLDRQEASREALFTPQRTQEGAAHDWHGR